MGFARISLMRNQQLKFWKLFGSGVGQGFTPIPNTAVYAIICVWPDKEIALQQMASARIFDKYRNRASESWTLFLNPISARGKWSKQKPFSVNPSTSDRPLAALTRATLKPSILLNFWKRVPEISDVIGNDPNVAFKIGIGEVPWLHQVTFSIWPDKEAMAQFARASGPHANAIKAVREEDWFREELYARFQIIDQQGSWMGKDPLEHLSLEPAL